jgi:tRNA G46 methylase TrmB
MPTSQESPFTSEVLDSLSDMGLITLIADMEQYPEDAKHLELLRNELKRRSAERHLNVHNSRRGL